MATPFARGVHTFPARFPGICEDCQEGFEPGTEVRYDDGNLVHADPDDCVSVPQATNSPCTKCWLVHAGDCF